MRYPVAVLILLSSACAAFGSIGDSRTGWRDRDGGLIPDTESRKSVGGFGATVVITSDADWEKKWNTPTETTPRFTTVNDLKIGDQATVLIFFANPKLDAAGNVDVTCDIKIIRPNKEVTYNEGLKGFAGKLQGPVTNTYLSETIIGFVGEASDPLGEWIVEVTVHDNIRNVSIPLTTKFTLAK